MSRWRLSDQRDAYGEINWVTMNVYMDRMLAGYWAADRANIPSVDVYIITVLALIGDDDYTHSEISFH